MATFEQALEGWADSINEWYRLGASIEEVENVFNTYFKDKKAYDDTSYVEMFLKKRDGTWSDSLDTADREELADQVELARGKSRLPTYEDLGGTLLNKVPHSSFYSGETQDE
tara:strand:+ start:4329 stop:4664 length:336 start_codon:yes stop_codon:yes gene_type:complete